jgi:hypothetical protein
MHWSLIATIIFEIIFIGLWILLLRFLMIFDVIDIFHLESVDESIRIATQVAFLIVASFPVLTGVTTTLLIIVKLLKNQVLCNEAQREMSKDET